MDTSNILPKSALGIIIMLGLSFFAVIGAFAAYTYLTQIQTNGEVKTPALITALPATFTWDDLTQNSTVSKVVQLHNSGQTNTAPLQITAYTLPVGVTFSTNSTALIPAGQTVSYKFTLSAAANAETRAFTSIIEVAEIS